PCSSSTDAPLPASKWRTLRASTRILFGNIQQYAVDVGDAVLAQRARRSEEFHARFALAPGERLRAQVRIVVAQLLQALLEGVQALHLEAEVIGSRAHDAGALVIGDA